MQVGVACFTGDHEAVGPALDRCRAAVGDHAPLSNQLPYFARAEAWAVLAAGDPPRAQQLFLEAAGRLRERPIYAARLTYEALRAGTPARRVARDLEALARRCDAPLTAAYAAHANARVADDGDALIAVVDEMETIGALRYATEVAADAASAFHRAGYQDSARRAATRCRVLHAQGQGGTLPPIAGLDEAETSLTSGSANSWTSPPAGSPTPRSPTVSSSRSARSSPTSTTPCRSSGSPTAKTSSSSSPPLR